LILNKTEVRLPDLFDRSILSLKGDIQISCFKDAEERSMEPFLFLNALHKLKLALNDQIRLAPPALIIEAKDIVLIGNGLIFDSKGRRIAAHQSFTEVGRYDVPANERLLIDTTHGYRLIPEVKIRLIEDDVAIISQTGQAVYGHWLVDILPRMVLMETIGFCGKYVFHTGLLPFAKQLLEILDIPISRIITYNPSLEALRFCSALIPGPLRLKSAFSSVAKITFDRLKKQENIDVTKKIFISRNKWSKNNQTITNRNELENIASSYGFDIVNPQNLTVSEQATLFASASVLAGEYGSGMHNSIFSTSSCRVLVFQSQAIPFFVQAGLCNLIGQSVGFVFGTPKDDKRIFSIDPKHAEYAFSQIA
jgi:capsular polysaccharide biosynthesis protein